LFYLSQVKGTRKPVDRNSVNATDIRVWWVRGIRIGPPSFARGDHDELHNYLEQTDWFLKTDRHQLRYCTPYLRHCTPILHSPCLIATEFLRLSQVNGPCTPVDRNSANSRIRLP